ncbi:MAG: Ig-like domain-containing protein, partial [Rubrobacter sp.]
LEGGPSNNRVQNNLIGTNTNGGPLGNGDTGVRLSSSGNGNRILSNSIFANGALGIDLGPGGVTPNDLDDPDTGPNNLQNFPVLTSATTLAGTTTVLGSLNSTPNRTFTLQFFSNPSGEEGKTFRFQRNVTTNANGNDSFTFAVPEAVAAGQTVTASATDAQGNTSEFSAPETVADGTPPAVSRVVPANDATGVSPAANVLAVFSESMRPASLNTTTFRLRKAGATAGVAARVTYDSAARRATLDPNANLQPGTTYVATVTPRARDEAGNQLDQDPNAAGNQGRIWRFTVRR